MAAMVKRLEQHKQAIVVLGKGHDLSGLVGKDTELVVLTVPALASDDGATKNEPGSGICCCSASGQSGRAICHRCRSGERYSEFV